MFLARDCLAFRAKSYSPSINKIYIENKYKCLNVEVIV